MAFCRFWRACGHHLNFLEPDMTQQFPDVEPDLDTSTTNNPIAMEAPALFDLGAVVATPPAPMARSNSPTLGHPKFPQAGRPDYDDSGVMAMRAAASLRR